LRAKTPPASIETPPTAPFPTTGISPTTNGRNSMLPVNWASADWVAKSPTAQERRSRLTNCDFISHPTTIAPHQVTVASCRGAGNHPITIAQPVPLSQTIAQSHLVHENGEMCCRRWATSDDLF